MGNLNPITIKQPRLPGLDLMRSIAILSVVLSHTAGFLHPLEGNKAIKLFLQLTQPVGILGVELFFALSGYLIGGILVKAYTSGTFDTTAIRTFWMRRWLRTLPVYWLVLTVAIVLYKMIGLQQVQSYKLLYYPFLQNLWSPHPRYFFGEAWSLGVEEWFYLTLPIAMLMADRIKPSPDRSRKLLTVFVSYLCVFLLIRITKALLSPDVLDQDSEIRKVVVFRLDALMYGVLVAYLHSCKHALLQKIKGPLLCLAIIGTAAIYWSLVRPGASVTSPANVYLRFVSNGFLHVALPLSFAMYLPSARGMQLRRNRIMVWTTGYVARISYAMYLVHYSLIFIPFFSFMHASEDNVVQLYLLYWLIVIVLSSIVYYGIERPIMRFRDKVTMVRSEQ